MSDSSPPPSTDPDLADDPEVGAEPAKRSRLRRVLQVALGLVVGLLLTEAVFYYRDDGAFPHLNLYTEDAQLGVRLLAGESMQLSFGGNPVTQVRINQDGLRGADLPLPGPNDVLVVGDSQVFGLGVEENETFSARLGALLPDAQIINAGIPTYGPPEYDRMVERYMAKRELKAVVYVVNFANDLVEAQRANAERHAVWDGWAVRRETAPAKVVAFPGRALLFRKSHAVYALRRWWFRKTGPTEAFSVPSEGSFKDIGFAAARAADEHLLALNTKRRLAMLQNAKVSVTNAELRASRDRFVALVNEQQIATENNREGWGSYWNPLTAAFAQPGDIVGTDDRGEYTAPLYATASLILAGAKVRRKIEEELRVRAKKNAADAKKIEPVLAALNDSQKRTDTIRAEVLPEVRAWSPLMPNLRKVKAMCDKAGARLLVVALPLDVQISDKEWDKYGLKPIDLKPARILIDDLIDAAIEVGATPVDLTAPLREAEPGAFLDRDIHMTPKGHQAVANAIAAAIKTPRVPTPKQPTAGRPLGRNLPTPLTAVRQRKEVQVPGSTAAGCETYVVDEWFTMRCHNGGEDRAVPIGIKVVEVPLNELVMYWDRSQPGPAALIIQLPLLRKQRAELIVRWPEQMRRLSVSWSGYWSTARSKNGNVNISFSTLYRPEDVKPDQVAAPPKPREALCKAVKGSGVKEACDELPLFDNRACFTTYGQDDMAVVECLRGERDPECQRGYAPVGVFQYCAQVCSKYVDCETGKCSEYGGAEVCL